MASTKRIAKERINLERDRIPYVTFIVDDDDSGGDSGSNILEWRFILELSPQHDSLDDAEIIGKASNCHYCAPPLIASTKEKSKGGLLAGVSRVAKATASKSSSDASALVANTRPAGSAFFAFKFVFPINYPFKPPIITVLSNSYHPNINTKTGEICDTMLTGDGWGPTLNIRKVCARLRKFLCDPDPHHPLESVIAQTLIDKPGDYAVAAFNHAGEYCTRERAMEALTKGQR